MNQDEGGDDVDLVIDNRCGTPIYEQIYRQLKEQILSGALREDEALPSIRSLAKDLRVSVITTKRAYDELEQDGFLYTVAGKGSFVAPRNVELLREEYLKKIEGMITEIARMAGSCRLSREDVLAMFELLWEE